MQLCVDFLALTNQSCRQKSSNTGNIEQRKILSLKWKRGGANGLKIKLKRGEKNSFRLNKNISKDQKLE